MPVTASRTRVRVLPSLRATDGIPLVPVERISFSISERGHVSRRCASGRLNILTGIRGILPKSPMSAIALGSRSMASHWALKNPLRFACSMADFRIASTREEDQHSADCR